MRGLSRTVMTDVMVLSWLADSTSFGFRKMHRQSSSQITPTSVGILSCMSDALYHQRIAVASSLWLFALGFARFLLNRVEGPQPLSWPLILRCVTSRVC